MVLEMVVGPVDRGACIRDLSQYPEEVEYLYLPMSFISPNGAPRFTIIADVLGMRVIPVRVNVNLSARTVEQLREQKKRTHCAAFRFLQDKLSGELDCLAKESDAAARLAGDPTKDQDGAHSVEGLINGILRQFEAVLKEHEKREEQDFADDVVFQGLVTEMLDAQRWAVYKLRLWLEDRTAYVCYVQNYSLREAHHRFTAFLTRSANAADTDEGRRVAALEVCKARGLLQARVEEFGEAPYDAGEASLVAAVAADGASAVDIRMLIIAGSAFNGPEGEPSASATAAAKYGKVDVLDALLKAKAAVNASIKVIWAVSVLLRIDCQALFGVRSWMV
jgi:hypothetical protein